MGRFQPRRIRLDGREERANVERVGGAYFDVLGVQPALGRVFPPPKTIPPRNPRRCSVTLTGNGDSMPIPLVLGRTLQYRDKLLTIAGVAPPRFAGLSVDAPADVFLPVASVTPVSILRGPRAHGTWSPRLIARLRPGISREQAQPAVNVLFARILQGENRLFRERDTAHRVSEAQHQDFLARELTLCPAAAGSPACGGNTRSPCSY